MIYYLFVNSDIEKAPFRYSYINKIKELITVELRICNKSSKHPEKLIIISIYIVLFTISNKYNRNVIKWEM